MIEYFRTTNPNLDDEITSWIESNGQPQESFSFFPVETYPIDMHRHFQQQMDEFMKKFFNFDPHSFNGSVVITEVPEEAPASDLREEFLKPGHDNDLDNQVSSREIETLMESKANPPNSHPHGSIFPRFGFRGFPGDWDSLFSQGQEQEGEQGAPGGTQRKETHRTIRHPDGSVETIKTVIIQGRL